MVMYRYYLYVSLCHIFFFNNECFNDVRTLKVCPNNSATNNQGSISTNITLSAYHRLVIFLIYCYLRFLFEGILLNQSKVRRSSLDIFFVFLQCLTYSVCKFLTNYFNPAHHLTNIFFLEILENTTFNSEHFNNFCFVFVISDWDVVTI